MFPWNWTCLTLCSVDTELITLSFKSGDWGMSSLVAWILVSHFKAEHLSLTYPPSSHLFSFLPCKWSDPRLWVGRHNQQAVFQTTLRLSAQQNESFHCPSIYAVFSDGHVVWCDLIIPWWEVDISFKWPRDHGLFHKNFGCGTSKLKRRRKVGEEVKGVWWPCSIQVSTHESLTCKAFLITQAKVTFILQEPSI